MVPCGFLLSFDVVRGALVWYHMGLCGAHVEKVFLVRILVKMLCTIFGLPSEVAQGPSLALSMGYVPSDVVSLGGESVLVKISVSCLRGAVCLSPNVVSGLVGVGLRRVWVRSTSACVAAPFKDIIDKVSVAVKNSVLLETIYFAVLGV